MDADAKGDEISSLFTEDDVKSETLIFKYYDNTLLKRDFQQKLNKLKEGNNVKITIKGFDENGNILNVADKILTKLIINVKYDNIEQEKNIPIKVIIDEIEKYKNS